MKPMPANPVALWHMNDRSDMTGTFPLAVHGEVELGVPLEGEERESSLARGGDGSAARFSGGYLSFADDPRFAITGGPFTVAIRMRDTAGKWEYPILGSYGSDREVSVALRALDGRRLGKEAGSASIYAWMFRDDGPRSVRGCQSLLEAIWGAEEPNVSRLDRFPPSRDPDAGPRTLAADVRSAVMRTCFPIGLIGPADWHDIAVSFTGPKLQLWIDGVLVDEEYPLGETRGRT